MLILEKYIRFKKPIRKKLKFELVKHLITILLFTFCAATYTAAQKLPVSETQQRIMKYYPNPAVSYIKFDFQKEFTKGYSIQVVSFIGKKVYEEKNINNSTTLELSNFLRGIYIYQLKNSFGQIIESGKFQVLK